MAKTHTPATTVIARMYFDKLALVVAAVDSALGAFVGAMSAVAVPPPTIARTATLPSGEILRTRVRA